MLKKSLKYQKIALLNTKNSDFFGYKIMLDQEKIPYEIITTIKGNWDLIILPINNLVPMPDLFDFVKQGGKILASYDEGSDDILAITDNLNTFQPFGNGIIYYHNFPFGQDIVETDMYAPSAKRNIIFQWAAYSASKNINNYKREIRLQFKSILYKLIGPITQIWYWPNDYKACYCQRVDVDFSIKLAFNKTNIIKCLLTKIDDFQDIKFSLFLNHTFKHQNKEIRHFLKDSLNVEFQSHGCNNNIKHRDYCYSLNFLLSEEILSMLKETVVDQKALIFAPPCEQANGLVLKHVEDLGIQFITAGGIAKDDLPRKCFFNDEANNILNKEFNIINIPTSKREFLSDYNLDYYKSIFDETIKDDSLFCIYFHPYTLLNRKVNTQLTAFFDYILEQRDKKRIWCPFMSELAIWWYHRDNLEIKDGGVIYKDNSTKTFFNKNPNLKFSIIKWSPNKITKLD